MKNTLKAIGEGLLLLAFADAAIVTAGIAQVALEGRTGEWAPFWRVQAEVVVALLGLR